MRIEDTDLNRSLQICKAGGRMIKEEVLTVRGVDGARRIEISVKRVMVWTLIFTNVFFISYFFGKLFRWI